MLQSASSSILIYARASLRTYHDVTVDTIPVKHIP